MAKRSGKFYINNEKQLMRKLGLKPTIASGAGWIEKEDGQNENVICQLKSTDANSFKLNLQDLKTLENNALISHKLPIFLIQFLKTDEQYIVVKLENIGCLEKYIKTGTVEMQECLIIEDEQTLVKKKKVKSGSREDFWNQKEKEFKKWKKK